MHCSSSLIRGLRTEPATDGGESQALHIRSMIIHDGEAQCLLKQAGFQELLQGFLAMRLAGRVAHLREDVVDGDKAMVILESVLNNLGTLYLYLRENPSVCQRINDSTDGL